MKPPQIETKRLLLHEISPLDAPAMYAYRRQREVYAFQAWRPRSVSEVQQYLSRSGTIGFNVAGTWFQLGVYLRNDGELVGDVGFHFLPPDGEQVEIGFTTSPAHQRKGYAWEAVAASIDYLFTGLKKHRIVGSVDPRNEASLGLLEKLGMKREAHFRRSVKIRGRWEDDVVYAILRDEWPAGKVRVTAPQTRA
jgi:RimJ/RimL family protein N-acetyltransferase